MQAIDLNELLIADGSHDEERELATQEQFRRRLPIQSVDGAIEVYFDDLEGRLIEHMGQARYVWGCVAWLTHVHILEALAQVRKVSIVVQKEDFLRPDTQKYSNWSSNLRAQYAVLHSFGALHHINGQLIDALSQFDVERIEAIRCVGNHNQDNNPAFPRSHHKFIVFGNPVPYAVWTGSFNFTSNSTKSFENALYITDANIVDAYYREYQHVFAFSEPLDWNSVWVAPEFRIGT